MIRYFDLTATDGGGVNVAELMAKQGIKTDGDFQVEIPSINTEEKKEEVKVEEPPKTETVQVEAKQEPVPADPPKQEPVVQPAPKPVEVDWKDVLKQQPEVDVYKHLGLDEKMINFLSRWKGGEDLTDYLNAATMDYTKMSPDEIMRRYYQKEFSGLSGEDFEEVYKMKVTEYFKLDPDIFDEKEVRRGKLLLNYEADKIRQDLIKKQQELLFSKPPTPEPPQHEAEARKLEAERQQAAVEYKGLIEKDAFTQELLNKKLMTIGDGEEAFNYEVAAPQEYLDVLFDPAKWSAKIFNADGTPNVRKQILMAAIANDDTSFLTNYAKHHQKIGAKRAIEPIENASPTIGTTSNEGAPLDPAAALAKAGIITSGN